MSATQASFTASVAPKGVRQKWPAPDFDGWRVAVPRLPFRSLGEIDRGVGGGIDDDAVVAPPPRRGQVGGCEIDIGTGGELDAWQDGHFLRRCGRGEGVGEIALLRAIPRTASVIAHTSATVYRLNTEPFLTAVLGHAPTQRLADRIADTRLATDAAPDDIDSP